MNILVVEDDVELNRSIVDLLTMEKFAVFPAHNLHEATRLLCKGFGVALLDIMLPDGEGHRIIERLRTSGEHTHIIMLTALSDGKSKQVCYDAGADDYITKPFDMTELLYKINAVKRRTEELPFSLQVGDLKIDRRTGEVCCGARSAVFQPSQVRLLESLAIKRQIGESLGIEEIGAQSLENDMDVRRRVRTLIARTRKAIRNMGSSKVNILSDYGCGYHLEIRR